MLVMTTHPITGETKTVEMNESEYRAAKILAPDTVRIASNFIVNETPVSNMFMAVKLAETIFSGDVTDIDAIRATTADLLFGKNRENNPTFSGVVDRTKSVDVWIWTPEFGWDKTAIFDVKDLIK